MERNPFGLSAETKRKLTKDLRRAADTYARAAKEASAKTAEEAPRGMMALVALTLWELFGTPMYGQAAVVAGLIMRRDVTPTMVREAVHILKNRKGTRDHMFLLHEDLELRRSS